MGRSRGGRKRYGQAAARAKQPAREAEAAFSVGFHPDDVVEANAEDSYAEDPARATALRAGFIDEQGAITRKGWDQLSDDVMRIERNAMAWMRKKFLHVRDEGHGSFDDLVGTFWFDPTDPEQAALVELAAQEGRQERIDMQDASYGDFAHTAMDGVSDFGWSVLGGAIYFDHVEPEDMEIIERTLETERKKRRPAKPAKRRSRKR
jgi:hypothetical protein